MGTVIHIRVMQAVSTNKPSHVWPTGFPKSQINEKRVIFSTKLWDRISTCNKTYWISFLSLWLPDSPLTAELAISPVWIPSFLTPLYKFQMDYRSKCKS